MPDNNLPVIQPEHGLSLAAVQSSPALALWFDDRMFDKAKQIATYLSRSEGFVPPHLAGKLEACFAVVAKSLTWRLDPYAVAACTYQTPGGKVGYEGKLVQAILESSGRLEGGVRYEHFGDWSKVQGKFKIAKSERGKEYAVPTWDRDDAIGVGVIVRAKIKGEDEPREHEFELAQAFPLNSTLWATDPKTQICYTAVRRFASLAMPATFMGLPFDSDLPVIDGSYYAEAAPPRPTAQSFGPATVVTEVEDPAGEDGGDPAGDLTEEEDPAGDEDIVNATANAMAKQEGQPADDDDGLGPFRRARPGDAEPPEDGDPDFGKFENGVTRVIVHMRDDDSGSDWARVVAAFERLLPTIDPGAASTLLLCHSDLLRTMRKQAPVEFEAFLRCAQAILPNYSGPVGK